MTTATPPWLPIIADADPDHVLVYRDDDDREPRRVAVTKRRQRWQQLRRVVDAMVWSRLEACDVRGGVMAVFPPTPARAPVVGPAAPPPLPAEWQAPSQALLAAFQAGGAQAHAQTAQLVQGYQGLLQGLMGTVVDLRAITADLATQNRAQLKGITELLEELASNRGRSSGGDDDDDGDPGAGILLELMRSRGGGRKSEGAPPRPAPRPTGPRPAGAPAETPRPRPAPVPVDAAG